MSTLRDSDHGAAIQVLAGNGTFTASRLQQKAEILKEFCANAGHDMAGSALAYGTTYSQIANMQTLLPVLQSDLAQLQYVIGEIEMHVKTWEADTLRKRP